MLRGLVAASQINPGVLGAFPFRAFCVPVLSNLKLAGSLTIYAACCVPGVRQFRGLFTSLSILCYYVSLVTRVFCVLTVYF